MLSVTRLKTRSRFLGVPFFICVMALAPLNGHADTTLRVATASNFKPALDQLIDTYTAHNPAIRFQVTSASSGIIFHQVSKGAPFDVFFSADKTYPETLLSNNKVHAPLYHYTSGTLCLVSQQSQPVSLQTLSQLKTLAIPNPKLAPYGLAAHTWLTDIAYPHTLVFGNNVSHTLSYLLTGHIQAAITACSLQPLVTPDTLNWQRIPIQDYPVIAQYAAIVSTTEHLLAAQAFIDYIQKQDAQTLLTTLGYQPINVTDHVKH